MTKQVFLPILGFVLFSFAAQAQHENTKEIEQLPAKTSEIEKTYEKRIKKSRLNNVYIPKDLYDAFEELSTLMDKEGLSIFKNLTEDEAGKKFYLITWITHNWGFWGGSRFSHYIKQIGIYHPEHMAHFVIITYHRKINGKELDIKERVEFYNQKIEEEKERRNKKGTVISTETRKRN